MCTEFDITVVYICICISFKFVCDTHATNFRTERHIASFKNELKTELYIHTGIRNFGLCDREVYSWCRTIDGHIYSIGDMEYMHMWEHYIIII
jgi:hypothetical protein